jgi:hypothetical protein
VTGLESSCLAAMFSNFATRSAMPPLTSRLDGRVLGLIVASQSCSSLLSSKAIEKSRYADGVVFSFSGKRIVSLPPNGSLLEQLSRSTLIIVST